MFTLTIGLNARAGAFFVLPALIIWAGIIFRGAGASRRALVSTTLAVALGMAANLGLTRIVGSAQGAAFSNYAYTLYGLVSGYTGWWDAANSYPDVSEAQIYAMAFEKFKHEPTLLLMGISRAYLDFFTPLNGAFNFMRLVYDRNNAAATLLWTFLLIGLVAAVLARGQPRFSLMLASFAGILASIALLPPSDSDSMRVHATTIPLLLFAAVMGTSMADRLVDRWRGPGRELAPADSAHATPAIAALTMAACVLGPISLTIFARSPGFPAAKACSADAVEFLARVGDGANFVLVRDDAAGESYIPFTRITDFTNGVTSGTVFGFYPNLDQLLLELEAGQSVSIATIWDPQDAGTADIWSGFLVTSGSTFPAGHHRVCALSIDDQAEIPVYSVAGIEGGQPIDYPGTHPGDPIRGVTLARSAYGAAALALLVLVLVELPIFLRLAAGVRLLMLANIAVILAGVLVYLHSNALLPVAWQRIELDVRVAAHVDQNAFQVPLGVSWMNQNSIHNPPVTVYEDGTPLKRPNAKIFAVKRLGQGRYFVQDGYLYISSSDNSDPRSNERKYELVWPTPVRARYQAALYAISAIALLAHLWFFTTLPRLFRRRPADRPATTDSSSAA